MKTKSTRNRTQTVTLWTATNDGRTTAKSAAKSLQAIDWFTTKTAAVKALKRDGVSPKKFVQVTIETQSD